MIRVRRPDGQPTRAVVLPMAGRPISLPLDETHPVRPWNAYALSTAPEDVADLARLLDIGGALVRR